MRRKSARTANKSAEKAKVETPVRQTRRSRRRKVSESSSDASDEEAKKSETYQAVEAAPTTAANEDVVWKVTKTESPSGEIQKLKISLSRTSPSTPERSKRRRNKSSSQTEDESCPSEDTVRRTRQRHASPTKLTEESVEEKEEKRGKGKSKGKNKTKIENSPQVSDIEQQKQYEISENVQVTPQSPSDTDKPVDTESIRDNNDDENAKLVPDACNDKPAETEATSESADEPVEAIKAEIKVDNETEPQNEIKRDVEHSSNDSKKYTIVDIKTSNAEIKFEIKNETAAENKPAVIKADLKEELVQEVVKNESENLQDVEMKSESLKSEDAVKNECKVETETQISQEEQSKATIVDAKLEDVQPQDEVPVSESDAQPEPALVANAEGKDKVEESNQVEAKPQEEEDLPKKRKSSRLVLKRHRESSETVSSVDNAEKSDNKPAETESEAKEEEANKSGEFCEKMDISADNFEDVIAQAQAKERDELQKQIAEEVEAAKTLETVEKQQSQLVEDQQSQLVETVEEQQSQLVENSESDTIEEQPRQLEDEAVERPQIETVEGKVEEIEQSQEETEKATKNQRNRAVEKQEKESVEKRVVVKKKSQPIRLNRTFVAKEDENEEETHQQYVRAKWNRDFQCLETVMPNLIQINYQIIKDLCPDVELLEEAEVRLEADARRVSIDRKFERKMSVDAEHAVLDRQVSLGSSKGADSEADDTTNIIAMNRKISIVDDSASKLRPPPSPAKHAAAPVLFITNLVRPFTIKQLRELLERTGKIVEDGFWTDKIKSKCYVHYETQEEAEATRNALHGVHWPIGNGKKLIIDYATPEDLETAKTLPVKPVEVSMPEKENQEPVEKREEQEERRKEAHVREWDVGKEGTQVAERGRSKSRERARSDKRRHARHSPSPPEDFMNKKTKKVDDVVPQKLMDDLFQKTKAVPSIYWQPLTPEEIATKQQQRLQRMAEHKRRMEETRSRGDFARGGPNSRRRYD